MSGNTTASTSAADPLPKDIRPRNPGTLRVYWALAGQYWRGPTKRKAWLLTFATIALVNAYFFNALEKRQSEVVLTAIIMFVVLAVASSAVSVFQLVARMRLQVFWRQWLTGRLAARWLEDQRFYRLTIAAPDLDAPEFRIAEDARIATEPVVDFGSGILSAILTAIVFFSVLWTVGGSATVGGVTIPGYMVFAAIFYSGLMSGSMLLFGRPLISRIEEKNAAEAQMRMALGRVRENAESIALIGGEADEIRSLADSMDALVQAWMRQIRQLARMTWMMGSNWAVAPVFPLLLEAPNYLNGTMTLGSLMQTAAAFVQVQVALNWLFDNYPRIAEWLASAGRVTQLWTAFGRLDASLGDSAGDRIMIAASPDANLRLEGLSVAQYNGRVMIDDADTVIVPGDRVLLTGESGSGKSTLIRAIAGLWPWGSGRVLVPKNMQIAFLPQRSYIPQGTLRSVLHYPGVAKPVHDDVLVAALSRCGLPLLIPRLDEEDAWDKQLSGGEQQRIGFARLLIQRPGLVIMDEATAALDTHSQASMMSLFQEELKGTTVVSVGHRPELEEFHTRKLTLRRQAMTEEPSEEDHARSRSLSKLLRRSLRPRASPDPAHPISQ
jgi:putative ATP-binding cassette transporter